MVNQCDRFTLTNVQPVWNVEHKATRFHIQYYLPPVCLYVCACPSSWAHKCVHKLSWPLSALPVKVDSSKSIRTTYSFHLIFFHITLSNCSTWRVIVSPLLHHHLAHFSRSQRRKITQFLRNGLPSVIRTHSHTEFALINIVPNWLCIQSDIRCPTYICMKMKK